MHDDHVALASTPAPKTEVVQPGAGIVILPNLMILPFPAPLRGVTRFGNWSALDLSSDRRRSRLLSLPLSSFGSRGLLMVPVQGSATGSYGPLCPGWFLV